MSRQPVLPKNDKGWSQDANGYRQALHEDLYPKNRAWVPSVGGVTSASIEGAYTSIAGFYSFSIRISGPTVSSSGSYLDLPVSTSQASVFSVSIGGGVMKAAVIEKGATRLYLPEWPSSGVVIISGLIVS